jgi:hypothetical protein
MFRWLRKQIDKAPPINDLTQWGCGKWFVVYPDGQQSTTMGRATAKNYAAIFGGVVKHVSEKGT